MRNLAGKICGLLRANKLDCAPRVGKLDGFLGLRAGHLRVSATAAEAIVVPQSRNLGWPWVPTQSAPGGRGGRLRR